ncbi:MAG: LysR family transcriptional regulator [Clostridia bacterium]|nr:LysR family transcriptional regulator [Clostridia bacterium]
METFKIKAVLAAVEYKSLSRAAEAYSYTPSAFSHMLSSFEDELGVRLFNRSSSGVTLTEEGKKLYPQFLELAESEKKLDAVLKEMSDRHNNQLRIGTYSSISRGFLSELIGSFSKKNPDIKLYISVVDNLFGWLEEDRADIIFADSEVVGDNEWIPLMEDQCSAVAPIGMIKGRTVVTREELYSYPHILMESECMKDYFDESKFKEVIHLTSEDDLSVINMVRQGLGITVLSDLVLKDNANGVTVFPLEPKVTRTIGFAYKKKAKQSSSALARFVRYIKEENQ